MVLMCAGSITVVKFLNLHLFESSLDTHMVYFLTYVIHEDACLGGSVGCASDW